MRLCGYLIMCWCENNCDTRSKRLGEHNRITLPFYATGDFLIKLPLSSSAHIVQVREIANRGVGFILRIAIKGFCAIYLRFYLCCQKKFSTSWHEQRVYKLCLPQV